MNKSIFVMIFMVSLFSSASALDINGLALDRHDAYPKIANDLEGMVPSGGLSAMSVGSADTVQVVVEMAGDDFSLDLFSGAKIEAVDGNRVQVLLPVSKLRTISSNPSVSYVRLPLRPHTLDAFSGVDAINADELHSIGVTGSGVKIGVIDLGFKDYGSLDNVVSVWPANFMSSEPHGTECAKILNNVAPGASLYLYRVDSDVTYAAAIDQAISDGVDIISSSIGWVNAGPYDGTGYICDNAEKAVSAGILYVNSAGNQAKKHYEGYFNDTDGDGYHDFSPGDEVIYLGYIPEENDITLFLSWDDWDAVDQDYNLILLGNDNGYLYVYDYSYNLQNGSDGQSPTESIMTVSSGLIYYAVIENHNSRGDAHFELYSFDNVFYRYNVSSSSLVIPADAPGVITVGATLYSDDSLEPFSSQGPTNDGRMKPDVTGPDGVSSPVYGSFYGTSASAPHVAGALALLNSSSPAYPVDYLYSTAVDLLIAGPDNMTGHGRIDVAAAYDALPVSLDLSDLTLTPGTSDVAGLSVVPLGIHSYFVISSDDELSFGSSGMTDVSGLGAINVSLSSSAVSGVYEYVVLVDGSHEVIGHVSVPSSPSVPEFPLMFMPVLLVIFAASRRF